MNIYQPLLATVIEMVDETSDTRTLKLEFQDEAVREAFAFKAGQFGEYGVFGAGESTFCIASSPTREGYIECSFKSIGKVTSALREVNVGDTVSFPNHRNRHYRVVSRHCNAGADMDDPQWLLRLEPLR